MPDHLFYLQIDPNRTISAGRVEIGAFRTYPKVSLIYPPLLSSPLTLLPSQDFVPAKASPSEYQSIPLNKIEDFGVHANSYYPLEISHFKSTSDAKLLDLLWNKYWVMTLSQSPLISVSISLFCPLLCLTLRKTDSYFVFYPT